MSILRILGLASLAVSFSASSQQVLSSNDLPQGGTTYVRATAIPPFNSGNLEETGADLTWDYSGLEVANESNTEYFSMGDASLTTQFVFSSADHFTAFELPDLGEDFALPISGATNYQEFGSNAYKTIGLGITTDIFDLPVTYDDEEELLPLPLIYGAELEGSSAYTVDLPELIYYSTSQTMTIEVDAWGTLVLPGGSYECLRVRRDFLAMDSVNVAAAGIGFSLPREGTVFEWYAAGEGMPVLSVQTLADLPANWQFKPNTSSVHGAPLLTTDWTAGPSPLQAGSRLGIFGLEGRRVLAMDIQGRTWFDGVPSADAQGAHLNTKGWPSGAMLIQDVVSGQTARVIIH